MECLFLSFAQLSVYQLHELLLLRNKVFVVEQQCIYQDPDPLDLESIHVLGRNDEQQLIAYCRLVPAGRIYPEAAIGRVLSHPDHRGLGYGRTLMTEAMQYIYTSLLQNAIRISAQCYLKAFYESLGFEAQGIPYEEDGIPHISMCTQQLIIHNFNTSST